MERPHITLTKSGCVLGEFDLALQSLSASERSVDQRAIWHRVWLPNANLSVLKLHPSADFLATIMTEKGWHRIDNFVLGVG